MHYGADAALEGAATIGLLGDIHGDVDALFLVMEAMASHNVSSLLALGDVGLLWPGSDPDVILPEVEARLSVYGQVLSFLEGNHDYITGLSRYQVERWMRRLRPNIIHLTRGYRTMLASGKTMAVLGGANSIDRYNRSHRTWWPEESVTDADLLALGHDSADYMFGHDAPLDLLSLDSYLAASKYLWSETSLRYAASGRAMFHRGFLQVRPTNYFGAHYHYPIDEVVGYFDGSEGFATRVVLLDMLQHSDAAATAILDVDTAEVRFFTVAGDEFPARPRQVIELTTRMTGQWMLHTLTSRYIVDLDAGTIARSPDSDAAASSNGVHRLKSIDVCRIGEQAQWIFSDDLAETENRHVSSIIRHIVPLTGGPAND